MPSRPLDPAEAAGLVRARRQADRARFRGLVRGGRVVWSDVPEGSYFPARALLNVEGRVVYVEDVD